MYELVVIVWLTKRGELELQFLPRLYYYQDSSTFRTLSLLKEFIKIAKLTQSDYLKKLAMNIVNILVAKINCLNNSKVLIISLSL